MDHHDPPTNTNTEPLGNDPAQRYQDDDIFIEYHPSSGRSSKVLKLDEYHQPATETSATVEPEPWAPFQTRQDFEFAEIALESGMTKKQTNAMIKLFHKCIEMGNGSFTILDQEDLASTFDIAANRLTKV